MTEMVCGRNVSKASHAPLDGEIARNHQVQHAQHVLARNHLGRCFFAVICHKISEKCWWNHGETFTVKIYKLGPKCRWNILIVGDNTAAKFIRVHIHTYSFVFCLFSFVFLLFRTAYFNLFIWYHFFFRDGILFIGYMSRHLVLRILSNPNISIGLHICRCYFFFSLTSW